MISIDDILVSDEILTEYFACDYAVCKGACCVIGESGAPLEKGEEGALEKAWPAFNPIMTDCGRRCVAAKGLFEIDGDGDMVTSLMEMSPAEREATGNKTLCENPDKPCAFTFFENGNCLCAVERAYILGLSKPGGDGTRDKGNGESASGSASVSKGFVKPISCRLYPIRVITFSDGSKALNLHRWNLCKCAFEKGRREGIKVYKFLKEPIIAAFGADFYAQLSAADGLLEELGPVVSFS